MKSTPSYPLVLLTTTFCLAILVTANAQKEQVIPATVQAKLQGLLPYEMAKAPEAFQPAGLATEIPVLITVAEPQVFSEIETLGGHVNTRFDNVATVRLPQKTLLEVAALPGVTSMEYNRVFRANNVVRTHTRADAVQSGMAPLPQGFTGQGVIVGVSDGGIDFRHRDFRLPSDSAKSRILAIWDQLGTAAAPPAGFSYGALWTRAQIEAELGPNPPGLVTAADDIPDAPGHGSHVTGTAAGNEGIAYGADIVFVRDDGSFNGLIDAVKFIRDYAKNLGKPCVVNLSVGTTLHNHEGNAYLSKFIDNLLNNTQQFAVVAAAGNEGFSLGHWGGFEMKNDTAMFFSGTAGPLYAYFRVPKTYGDSLDFTIGVDSAHFDFSQLSFNGGSKFLGNMRWTSVKNLVNTTYTFYRPSGSIAGKVQIIPQTNVGLSYYSFIVAVDDRTNSLDWHEHTNEMDVFRFEFRGSGRFHGWLFGLPWVITNPENLGLPSTHFVPSDNELGIISPADGNNVIAVGAYVNRPDWTDVTGQTHYFHTPQPSGELADFSSHGPRLDGYLKPEITAPGKHVFSAYPTYYDTLNVPYAFLNGGNPLWIITDNAPHACYSGTSMAAPAVTGCVALLLEAKPDLDYKKIRDLLTATAQKDVYTNAFGPLPNGFWGHGKVDIFNTVLAALGLSNTTTASAKIWPPFVFPNPAQDHFTVLFKEATNGQLTFYYPDGRVVFSETWRNEHDRTFSAAALPAGVYVWKWTSDDFGKTASGKVIVAH